MPPNRIFKPGCMNSYKELLRTSTHTHPQAIRNRTTSHRKHFPQSKSLRPLRILLLFHMTFSPPTILTARSARSYIRYQLRPYQASTCNSKTSQKAGTFTWRVSITLNMAPLLRRRQALRSRTCHHTRPRTTTWSRSPNLLARNWIAVPCGP